VLDPHRRADDALAQVSCPICGERLERRIRTIRGQIVGGLFCIFCGSGFCDVRTSHGIARLSRDTSKDIDIVTINGKSVVKPLGTWP
jgi:hypothetical protein